VLDVRQMVARAPRLGDEVMDAQVRRRFYDAMFGWPDVHLAPDGGGEARCGRR
jgi:hypothetical protein